MNFSKKIILLLLAESLFISTAFAGSWTGHNWTIKQQEINGNHATYIIQCRPGGMTAIIPANLGWNQYWDANGGLHSSLDSAVSASCN